MSNLFHQIIFTIKSSTHIEWGCILSIHVPGEVQLPYTNWFLTNERRAWLLLDPPEHSEKVTKTHKHALWRTLDSDRPYLGQTASRARRKYRNRTRDYRPNRGEIPETLMTDETLTDQQLLWGNTHTHTHSGNVFVSMGDEDSSWVREWATASLN